MSAIKPMQVVKIHELSQLLGQECPRTKDMTFKQARQTIADLKLKIKELNDDPN